MVMGAEETWGPVLAENGDNRMTKVGCFIRKWKLDELPQLINIFMGDMSFVGPRPERPEIMADIVKAVPEFVYRTTVPAGLTGYAQVHSEYHTDFGDKLKWDLMYIENYSLMLDFKIILTGGKSAVFMYDLTFVDSVVPESVKSSSVIPISAAS